MLRFILTILKITGILLLVIVLLLLAVLLALIFVPIRYRLQAVYTSREMGGEIRITWLFHLLSVRLSVSESSSDNEPGKRTDEEPEPLNARLSKIRMFYEIRILGINLASALAFFRKIRASKKERQTAARGHSDQKRARGKVKREKAEGRREARSDKAGKEKSSSTQVNESGKEKRSSTQVNESEKAKQSTVQGNEGKEAKHSTERAKEAEEPDHSFSQDKAQHGAGQSFFKKTENVEENAKKTGNLLYKLSEFCDTIKQIPSRLKRCYRQIRKILKKPGQIQKRISKFVRKLEKYQASEVLAEAWHELGRLLHHYRVRKGSGYLRFGTGDPALTGEITGVLYMVLPAECGDVSIEPQFTETVFETELRIRGHIRIVHLLRTVWWVFRNRKMRRLIRAFQK